MKQLLLSIAVLSLLVADADAANRFFSFRGLRRGKVSRPAPETQAPTVVSGTPVMSEKEMMRFGSSVLVRERSNADHVQEKFVRQPKS